MADARRLGSDNVSLDAARHRGIPRGIRGWCRITRGRGRAGDDAEPGSVQDARAADPDQPSAKATRAASHATRAAAATVISSAVPGATTYNDEQTRRNFERVQRLVLPGEPLKSPLLVNPLAEEAGGSHWHGGGKHWQSQNDPEWQTLAAWVRGS